jgi:hypothetical protein
MEDGMEAHNVPSFSIYCSHHLQGEGGKRRMQHNTEVHCEGYASDSPLPFTPKTITVMYAEMLEQLQ